MSNEISKQTNCERRERLFGIRTRERVIIIIIRRVREPITACVCFCFCADEERDDGVARAAAAARQRRVGQRADDQDFDKGGAQPGPRRHGDAGSEDPHRGRGHHRGEETRRPPAVRGQSELATRGFVAGVGVHFAGVAVVHFAGGQCAGTGRGAVRLGLREKRKGRRRGQTVAQPVHRGLGRHTRDHRSPRAGRRERHASVEERESDQRHIGAERWRRQERATAAAQGGVRQTVRVARVQRRVAGVPQETGTTAGDLDSRTTAGVLDGRTTAGVLDGRTTAGECGAARREVHDGQDTRLHQEHQRQHPGRRRPRGQGHVRARAQNGSSRDARAQRERVPKLRGVLAAQNRIAVGVRGERPRARTAVRPPRARRAGGQVRTSATGATGATDATAFAGRQRGPEGRPATASPVLFRARHPRGPQPVRVRTRSGERVPGEGAQKVLGSALQLPGQTRQVQQSLRQ